jgi:hypothetical protein
MSICLPASLEKIDGSAFAESSISGIRVEDGNRHLRLSGNFLLDFEGTSVIRYLGCDSSVSLSCEIEILTGGSFYCCRSLCSLEFESGSKLIGIEANALYTCESLKSICLPASVEFVGEGSFWNCTSLSSFTFESGSESQLTRIESYALSCCSSLRSICLPASVESLGERSFMRCESLSSLTFESGSKLSRIERLAFDCCFKLKSIVIPRSTRELRKDWALCSSLVYVVFESVVSLRTMIENDQIDLRKHFEIKFVDRDCGLDFRGYSVETVPGVNDCFRLKKT